MSENKPKIDEAIAQSDVDLLVSNDLALEVEEKFFNAMMGIQEIPQEYPGGCFTNYLKAAYDQARAMKLDETLILKHCCTVLTKIINDNQTKKLNQALNSC